MAIQIRAPIADVIASGTWSGSAGTRYTLIDDYPDATTADILTHGTTTAGTIYFNTENSTVPSGSAIQSVQLLYYNYKNGTASCNFNGRLSFKNATLVITGDVAHNPGNGIANVALRTHTWTTNPKTGAAWTDAEVNGNGLAANSLAGIGFISTDASPSISVTSAALVINYTIPTSARTNFTLNSDLEVRANISMNHYGAADLNHVYIFAASGIVDALTGTVHLGEISINNVYNTIFNGILDIKIASTLFNNYTVAQNIITDKNGLVSLNNNFILNTDVILNKNAISALTNVYTMVGNLSQYEVLQIVYNSNLFKSKLFNSNIFH